MNVTHDWPEASTERFARDTHRRDIMGHFGSMEEDVEIWLGQLGTGNGRRRYATCDGIG
uniref:Uncharacterized protein n=1 Tax=Cucumis melo TaxID=3656 RepID=A0A9I9DQX4_CUCME